MTPFLAPLSELSPAQTFKDPAAIEKIESFGTNIVADDLAGLGLIQDSRNRVL